MKIDSISKNFRVNFDAKILESYFGATFGANFFKVIFRGLFFPLKFWIYKLESKIESKKIPNRNSASARRRLLAPNLASCTILDLKQNSVKLHLDLINFFIIACSDSILEVVWTPIIKSSFL